MRAVVADLDETLFTISTEQRQAVVNYFMDWFNHGVRLSPVPDLAGRIARMEKKLRKMAENLEVSLQRGSLVVKSDADSLVLLTLLRRGSAWFEPHPNVDAAIMAALLESAT
jgi:hypothetical protein